MPEHPTTRVMRKNGAIHSTNASQRIERETGSPGRFSPHSESPEKKGVRERKPFPLSATNVGVRDGKSFAADLAPTRATSGTRNSARGKSGASRNDEGLEARLCALVAAVRAGDSAALAALYNLTVPLLFSVARRVLANPADAEEVICDVYIQVWRTAAQYDNVRGPVRAWLVMICRSRAIDKKRQQKFCIQIDTAADIDGAALVSKSHGLDECLQTLQQNALLRNAIFRLSPVRRRLVELAFGRALSHCEIAILTGLALGTVKSHLRRALAALRHDLGSKFENAPTSCDTAVASNSVLTGAAAAQRRIAATI